MKKKIKNLFKKAKTDMVVVNDISRTDIGFESDMNEVYVFKKSGAVKHFPIAPKIEIASKILDLIIGNISEKKLPQTTLQHKS